jgi:hypothetical protein
MPCGVRAGTLPGVAGARESVRIGEALRRDDAFERGEPMMVVGFAGIGIAGGLRFLDLAAERGGPFFPGKHAALVERQSERKGLRFPRLTKHRAFCVTRDALQRLGCASGGFVHRGAASK